MIVLDRVFFAGFFKVGLPKKNPPGFFGYVHGCPNPDKNSTMSVRIMKLTDLTSNATLAATAAAVVVSGPYTRNHQ